MAERKQHPINFVIEEKNELVSIIRVEHQSENNYLTLA
jgi:hypothetical protein